MTFEGKPAVARRIVIKPEKSVAEFITRTPSRILVVYYVIQEVRGAYVSCILSHYVDNEEDYKLSPLLQEVMSITDK